MNCYVLDARTATDHFPGIGRYAANLARAMEPILAEDERLVLLHNPAQPSHWNLEALARNRVHLVETSLSPFSLRQQWIVPRLLSQLRADAYHSPYYLMPYRPGVPVIVTLHDLIPLRYPDYFSLPQRLIFAVTVRLALRTAQHVIAVSQATALDLRHFLRLPSTRLSVILEAADPIFRPQPQGIVDNVRARLALPKRYVLYVGSNKPHKNLVRLVTAWAQLQPQPLPLVIAGIWDARYPEAKQQAESFDLGNAIRFVGSVPAADLPALYTGAFVFVFPSEYEGFGLPVLEAMACDTPVSCSQTSSLPEVVGDAALMFDPTSVDVIAETLQRLIEDDDLRHELQQRASARAKLFSWERTSSKTLQQYRKIIRG